MVGASMMMGRWTTMGGVVVPSQLEHWEDVRWTLPRVSSGEGDAKCCWAAIRCLDFERDLDLLRGFGSW